MRITIFACLAMWLLGVVLAQEAKPLCPRHVEPPFYPHVVRVAHVQGKVILLVTIDADGKVIDAEATNDEQRVLLLKLSTASSIRRWTFTKPPFAPYKQMITSL